MDSNLKLAAVATNSGGLQIVDISDPLLPTVSNTINISANQVEISDGIAYTAVGNTVQAIDLLTGEELEQLALLGSGNITDLTREGDQLYSYTSGADIFSVIDISNEGVPILDGQVNISIPTSQVGVFAANGIAFLAGSGLRSVDVSDPTNPTLIANADLNFVAEEIALNGSGLALVAQNNLGLGVYDISDPEDTDNFLTSVNTPGNSNNIAIASGIAYVADGFSGIQVINYLPFDNQGQAPTIDINTTADVDDSTLGIQVVEGTSIQPPNSVFWNSDNDGDWNNPVNWSTGFVPGASDNVIINRLNANPVITISSNVTVNSLQSEESLTISNGSLRVFNDSEVNGDLIINGNSDLTVDIPGVSFIANGQIAISDTTEITANGAGSSIVLPTLETFIDSDNLSADGFLSVINGGTIVADNLTTLSGVDLFSNGSNLSFLNLLNYGGNNLIQAINTGTLNLSNLTEIPTGELDIVADGTDSFVDVSSLLTGVDSFTTDARNGGIITVG